MAAALNVGLEPLLKVVTPLKPTVPVRARFCPTNDVVKLEIVIFDVVAFSSLMIRTSAGVIAVTAGSSLTLILANVLRNNFSHYLGYDL